MICILVRRSAIALLAVISLAQIASAQTSYPMLMSLSPVAAQTGQTSEHTIKSRYDLRGAYEVLVSGEGVVGEIVPPAEAKPDKNGKLPSITKLKIKFLVADNAMLGVRDFRIATPRGVSTLGQLVIGRNVVITAEEKKNNTAEDAQEIAIPSTVCGVIEKAEDVDFFKFKATAGQKLSFHVRSMRLQNKIHDLQQHSDPIVTLRNSAGVTVAASDNVFFGDPFLEYTAQQEGDYFLEIRDVRYQGNQYWEYSIEISDQPFLTNIYPLAIAPGKKTPVELIGHHLSTESAELELPSDTPPGGRLAVIALPDKTQSNPVPVIVADLPLVLESGDPNNDPESAQPITTPCGVNGRLEVESDIDCYAFEAKKGETFTWELIGRRRSSAIDSHLRILDATGKQLVLNDDLKLGKRNFSDSWIENWKAPADGTYIVEVRDLHLRGGKPFVYYLRGERSRPYFELYADTDKTPITPGTGGALFVRVVRKNGFTGAIQLHVDEVPPGVTAHCGRILASKTDGVIVFSGSPEAERLVGNVVIRGVAIAEEGDEPPAPEIAAIAQVYQETYQPGGGRGHWPVGMHTVSVNDPGDILSVTLSETEITLAPGETKQIDVIIDRAEGFDKNVTLDALYRHLAGVFGDSLPKGVTLVAGDSKTLLTAGATQGNLTFKADDKAEPAEKQQVAVMANVALNFVMKATYVGPPLFVTVTPKED